MARPDTELLDAAWGLIDDAGSIIIAMHQNPDGDALGSGLGLTLALRDWGKDVRLVCPQTAPEVYDYLCPGEFTQPHAPEGPADLAILVDCDRPDRTGAVEDAVKRARRSLVIDHHPPTAEFGDVRLTQVEAAATSELVYFLLERREVAVSHQAACALLTGLITDTGAFRFRNTRPESLEVAAALTRKGPSTAELAELIYDTRSLASLKLLSRTLGSLQLSPAGNIAWAKLSLEDFAETGARPEDTEGFVNLVHALRGADVAAMLREEAPGTTRVSLRSRGATQVNRVAEALGGGGHAMAAACVLNAPLPDAEGLVLDELKKWTAF